MLVTTPATSLGFYLLTLRGRVFLIVFSKNRRRFFADLSHETARALVSASPAVCAAPAPRRLRGRLPAQAHLVPSRCMEPCLLHLTFPALPRAVPKRRPASPRLEPGRPRNTLTLRGAVSSQGLKVSPPPPPAPRHLPPLP